MVLVVWSLQLTCIFLSRKHNYVLELGLKLRDITEAGVRVSLLLFTSILIHAIADLHS